MAEGRNRRLWDHSATIAAAALSAFRDKMIDPARLHPYEHGGKRSGSFGKRGIPITRDNIGLLKTVFVDGPAARAGHNVKERK